MGRRRQSPAEDVMDLVALMPWWAGIALAAISFVVLRGFAVPPASPSGVPGPDFMTRAVIAALAGAGQYLLPSLCIFGALASFLRRKKRAALFAKATSAIQEQAIAGMTWREFELLVGEAYRLHGYSVVEMGGGGADGGVDLVLHRDNQRLFVQCKHWKSSTVGVAVVRELFGVMSVRGATGGVIVTGGAFTTDARAFAAECKVQLVDRSTLPDLLAHAKAARSGRAAEQRARARADAHATSAPVQAEEIPACPTCGSSMVRRTARRGASAGAQFWGCSRFPGCRGTR